MDDSYDYDDAIERLTVDNAFEKRMMCKEVLRREELSRHVRVSVEGYDTSLNFADAIRDVLIKYFHSHGIPTFCVMVPRDRVTKAIRRFATVYLFNEGDLKKALALSGTNVGFPVPPTYFVPQRVGGWDIVVKDLPQKPFPFTPDQVAASRKFNSTPSYDVFVTGYPISLPADDVKKALIKLFKPCGEILYLTLDEDPSQPGLLHQSGYMSIAGEGALDKVVELRGSDVGGWNVAVKTIAEVNEEIRNKPIPASALLGTGWDGPPGRRWCDINPSTSTSTSQ